MEKKVRRSKSLKSIDKKFKDARMGAPPLEERELDENQKKFAVMVGRGVPIEVAQKYCGFSDYQRKTYLDLPKVQAEIRRWKEVFGEEDAERIKQMNDMVEKTAFAELVRRIEAGSISESNLMKLIERALQRVSLTEQSPVMESTKITEKIKRTLGGRQKMEAIPFDEVDTVEGETEEIERSIEQKQENEPETGE